MNEPPTVAVSVVIPVYRSEDCLERLVQETEAAFQSSGRTHEIVLVNDGSPDGSWEKIVDLAGRYLTVRGVNLRRNFGQDNALMAGLRVATGRIVVIMDDDLQHSPWDADRLIQQVEQGFDVCYARFPVKKQALWKNVGSWLNGKVANVVLGKPDRIYLSPYKAIAGAVVREIVKYEGPYPYVDGLLLRVTDNITQIDVEHHERYAGRGNFNLVRSVSTWLKLATSFSLTPLRIASILGFGFACFGLGLAAFFAVRQLVGRGAPLGWASTIVAILVLGGVQLACLGLIGEYLGRVFLHLNRRPQYVVKEMCGGPGSAGGDARDRENV